MLNVRPLAALKIFNINAGKSVGVLGVSNTGVVRQGVGVGPGHVN